MILEVNEVSKKFTNHVALSNVTLAVPEGAVYGLLGPNGAGKTTLIRIINHITAPDSGSVNFQGHPLSDCDLTQIGYLPEERGLYKKMKVGEQAMFFAQLKGLSRHDAQTRLKTWFEKFEIMEWWNKKVSELSKGMAQKVQFIVTVLHEPKLLIFDEPFSGFDPVNAQLLKDEILALRNNGSTIIFSTHNMSSVEEICDSFTLINRSKNILSGNVEDVKHQFAKGRYDFTVEGDATALIPKLMPLVENSDIIPLPLNRTQLSVKLRPEVELSDAIAAVNSSSRLVGLSENLPTMNDIFISAVTSSSSNDK